MDILAWLWWLLMKALGLVWALAWLLLGGWVSTAAQITVIALAIFAYRYGWRRAPQELASRIVPLARMLWGWLRGREVAEKARTPPATSRADARKARRLRRTRRRPGDVNLSTLMNLALVTGLWLLAVL